MFGCCPREVSLFLRRKKGEVDLGDKGGSGVGEDKRGGTDDVTYERRIKKQNKTKRQSLNLYNSPLICPKDSRINMQFSSRPVLTCSGILCFWATKW